MRSTLNEVHQWLPMGWMHRFSALTGAELIRRCLRPAFLFLALVGANQLQAIEVIVNPSASVEKLSTRELRAIYTMRLDRWSNGSEIQVFVLPQKHPLHQKFSKSVLEALPHQLQAVWYRLVYSGMGRAPTEVSDEQEMIERVRQTPGAIGYVEGNHEISNVQVLTIEAVH